MPQIGGVARRATVIKQERGRGGVVLVLDAGNSLTGDQDPAFKTKGATSIAALNLLGYDAMTLGSKDLALGLDVLRQRIGEAKFPVLSANAVISPTGELIAQPFVVREIGGHHIAIVGLTDGPGTAEVTVRGPLATAKQIVPEARRSADIVILLSHASMEVDKTIADAVPGITLIVSGGQGIQATAWISKVNGTPMLHADEPSIGHAGRYIGLAKLNFDGRGKLTLDKWTRLSLGPEFIGDPTMSAWVLEQSK
jgi:5'-nucleotidase / UDP-sugar diphosphatase